jgi:hypothetical protein
MIQKSLALGLSAIGVLRRTLLVFALAAGAILPSCARVSNDLGSWESILTTDPEGHTHKTFSDIGAKWTFIHNGNPDGRRLSLTYRVTSDILSNAEWLFHTTYGAIDSDYQAAFERRTYTYAKIGYPLSGQFRLNGETETCRVEGTTTCRMPLNPRDYYPFDVAEFC